MRVALSLGVDATVIVQGQQVIRSNNKIVSGSSPNHYLDISDKSKEEMMNVLKECFDRNKDVVAAEVKVAVESLHKTPLKIWPEYVVDRLPQTINKSNYWG